MATRRASCKSRAKMVFQLEASASLECVEVETLKAPQGNEGGDRRDGSLGQGKDTGTRGHKVMSVDLRPFKAHSC
eukprot:761363-Hanusia_phi.AAC.7